MFKKKIAISTSSFAENDPSPLELLKKHDIAVIMNPFKRKMNESEIIEFVKDVDGLIAGVEPITRKVLQSSKRLKAIARVGIGLSNIDLKAASEFGIAISNTPEGPTEAVAEMTIAALLALLRKIFEYSNDLHNEVWNKKIGLGLKGLNIFIVGYGRIGKRFAQLVSAFNGNIYVYDPFISSISNDFNEKYVSLKDGLEIADVISLHSSGEETLLSDEEFSIMKDGVIILNSARGFLIDENALVKSLESKKVSGAWCDVFVNEPYSGPLQKYKSVLLTPHVATYTQQCRKSMECASVKNILSDIGILKE